MAALPKYLADLQQANPGSRCVYDVDADGRLLRYFILLKPVYLFTKEIGRPVSGSDFGHLQHHCHDGTMATGNFKTGNGDEHPVWLAYFAQSESTDSWKYIAENIKVGSHVVVGRRPTPFWGCGSLKSM